MRLSRSKSLARRARVPLFEAVEGRVLFAGVPVTTTVLTHTPVAGGSPTLGSTGSIYVVGTTPAPATGSMVSQPLTLTASVTAAAGSGAPTGTVAFFEIVDFSRDTHHSYSSADFVTFPNPVDPLVTDTGVLLGTAS